jgi:hypothetical protein
MPDSKEKHNPAQYCVTKMNCQLAVKLVFGHRQEWHLELLKAT